ncbi:MAG: MFS transporter, partial [Deltaproteobacteria bacterium]|nr:MFS transporter [Deltaproteobacteria bacterium]
FMHASMTFFLPTFIKIETGNLWLAGASLTIFEGAGVIGILAAGHFSDRFGRRQILLAALLSAPLSLFMFIWCSGWLRYIALIFSGFTILSTTPVMLALVQEHAQNSPSAANGFFMMLSFMARSAIVVIVGLIADIIGLHDTFFCRLRL